MSLHIHPMVVFIIILSVDVILIRSNKARGWGAAVRPMTLLSSHLHTLPFLLHHVLHDIPDTVLHLSMYPVISDIVVQFLAVQCTHTTKLTKLGASANTAHACHTRYLGLNSCSAIWPQ